MKFNFLNLSDFSPVARFCMVSDSSRAVGLLLFVTVAILFLPNRAIATSIVALIDGTNHRVVMAADCRVRFRSSSISECKIIDEPGCTVAIAGLYRESATCFNLRRLVGASADTPVTCGRKRKPFCGSPRVLTKRPFDECERRTPGNF
jgi:hypothetical protein